MKVILISVHGGGTWRFLKTCTLRTLEPRANKKGGGRLPTNPNDSVRRRSYFKVFGRTLTGH